MAQPPRDRPQIKPLTSARFFAALLVVIFHYDLTAKAFPSWIADFGYEAVTFFFVLSGFVLTYAHGAESGLNISWRRFALARVGRIFPAYYLALLISAPFFIAAAMKGHAGVWSDGALMLSMLQAWWPPAALAWNDPAWSLSNEMFFYAVFPIAWLCVLRISPASTLLLTYTLIVLTDLIRGSISDHNLSAYWPLLNLPQFLFGMALAKYFVFHKAQSSGNATFVFAVAAIILTMALKHRMPWLVSPSVLSLTFAATIYGLIGITGHIKGALSAASLIALGEASYAIYILHVPIWMWWDRTTRVLFGLHISAVFDFIGYALTVVLLSLSATYFMERPIRRTLSKMFRPSALAYPA